MRLADFPLPLLSLSLFLNRMIALDSSRLLAKAFMCSQELHTQGHKSWVGDFICNAQHIHLHVSFSHQLPVLPIFQQLEQQYSSSLQIMFQSSPSSKLITYNPFRTPDHFCQEYLHTFQHSRIREIFIRFRTGSHWLEIEQERFSRQSQDNRTCTACSLGLLGDESHMIFHCPIYRDIRQKYACLFTCAHDVQTLMQQDYRKIAGFIYQCHELYNRQNWLSLPSCPFWC